MPVGVRYIVNDVDAALPFYTELLGFAVEMHRRRASPRCHEAICGCS